MTGRAGLAELLADGSAGLVDALLLGCKAVGVGMASPAGETLLWLKATKGELPNSIGKPFTLLPVDCAAPEDC